jgi:hypothetical protein
MTDPVMMENSSKTRKTDTAIDTDGRRKSLADFAKISLEKQTGLNLGPKSPLKKVQYVTILLICTTLLLFQSVQCVIKFREKATGTGDKYVHISTTSFPVMSICPSYPYKLDKLREHGLDVRSDIQWDAVWVSNRSQVSPREFYDDVTHSIEEILSRVEIYAAAEMNGTNIFELRGNYTLCGQDLYKTLPYYYNGDCFALVMPDCLLDIGILEIVLDFGFDKTDVFIHHPGQFLSPNSRYTNSKYLYCLTRSKIVYI